MPYINTVGASMLTSTHVLYKGLEYIQHLLCVCRCAGPHCTLGFGSDLDMSSSSEHKRTAAVRSSTCICNALLNRTGIVHDV